MQVDLDCGRPGRRARTVLPALAISSFVVSVVASTWWAVPPAHAFPVSYDHFKAAYPSSPLSSFSSTAPSTGCLVCHTSNTGGVRNSYGTAFAALPHNTQQTAVASLHSLDSSDSDGDGFTNLTEINAGFFPGDPLSHPPPFNYTLSNSGGITVSRGASGSNTITATLTAGSTQSVSFSASGLPSGATASFSLGACSPTCTGQLTISTAASTSTGTFQITVTGTPLNKTTTFNLAVNPPFDYTLTNTVDITVIRGASGSNTITATLASGLTQSVSLSASGLPSGATAGFSPGACNPTCTSQLTISTTPSTPTGTFPITVTGTPLNKTTTFNLVVSPVQFEYSLTNSGGITVTRGASGSNTITATLTSGLTQSVAFSASGLPSGATAGFSPGACNPTCASQLTISTTGATPTGAFPITVTGSPLSRTTTFNLVVNPPGPNISLGLTLNHHTITAGDLLQVSASLGNSGDASVQDFFFVIIGPPAFSTLLGCPMGDGIVFLFNSFLSASFPCVNMAPPQSFPPLASGVLVPAALSPVSIPNVFSIVWPPDVPPGSYTFAIFSTPPSAFADGNVGPRDITAVAADTVVSSP